jgi:hypothetical protein
MIGEIPSASNMGAVARELATAPFESIANGSGDGGYDFAPGWVNGIRNCRLLGKGWPDISKQFPLTMAAIDELRTMIGRHNITQIMVNELAARHTLTPHRDGPPDDYRYHLPVVTVEGAVWWDEYSGAVHMKQGIWHGPVPYCGVLHSFANDTDINRLHVVVDFGHSL